MVFLLRVIINCSKCIYNLILFFTAFSIPLLEIWSFVMQARKVYSIIRQVHTFSNSTINLFFKPNWLYICLFTSPKYFYYCTFDVSRIQEMSIHVLVIIIINSEVDLTNICNLLRCDLETSFKFLW